MSTGRDPGVEGAVVEQRLDGVGERLAGDVVEVRLELDELLALAGGRWHVSDSAGRPMTTWVQFGRSSSSR